MSVPGPVLGPCEAWIGASDVADCCGTSGDDDSPSRFSDVALEASMLLFEISGRQFHGVCPRTVRPCRSNNSCWDAFGAGGGWAGGWAWSAFGGWGWWDENGQSRTCGCPPLEQVKLAGYPVRDVLEVKIDGAVVDPATYRLDGWRYLVRTPGSWPACQNMGLADTEVGTFSITYLWGVQPPESGRRAAAALACELYRACSGGGGECQVPSGATKTVRQGVTFERKLLREWLSGGKTGIEALDVFIQAYNKSGAARRPAVWSPDVVQYPRTVGA